MSCSTARSSKSESERSGGGAARLLLCPLTLPGSTVAEPWFVQQGDAIPENAVGPTSVHLSEIVSHDSDMEEAKAKLG